LGQKEGVLKGYDEVKRNCAIEQSEENGKAMSECSNP
jgi:hypothetical protein